MSLRFLLDTNVLSEPLKPKPDPGIMSRLEQNRGEVATAAPVWNELLFGCYHLPPSRRRHILEQYLTLTLAPAIPVLPYDSKSAEWHAQERARLAGKGKTPAFIDGQIASVAQVRRMILVTKNVSDFTDFESLVVEDWST